VKLVEGTELLRRQFLIVRAEHTESRLHALGQIGRAIVIAHGVKDIGHWGVSVNVQPIVASPGLGSAATCHRHGHM
jgi:hypothetical protein